jgi:hypothetical protein
MIKITVTGKIGNGSLELDGMERTAGASFEVSALSADLSDALSTGYITAVGIIDLEGTVAHAVAADTATNAGHATTATTATNAGHATTADSATNADHATTADTATNAGHATVADSATTATTATTATNAGHATTADSATTATTATTATNADHATTADTATSATSATDAAYLNGYEVVSHASTGALNGVATGISEQYLDGFTGLSATDIPIRLTKQTLQAGLTILGCSFANSTTLSVIFFNSGAPVITPTAGDTYTLYALKHKA